MLEGMDPKPAHLASCHAAQFEDASVAAAYRTRPPYPPETFSVLARLVLPGPRHVLELGCGTGDLTIPLASDVERVDAIDPSSAMLALARRRSIGEGRVRWIHAPAETAPLQGPYALAVAAESLHWMDWDVVLPRIAAELVPGGMLAIVTRGRAERAPWDAELGALIARHSTNREYRAVDLIVELASRGLFREAGRATTAAVPHAQSIDEHVESFHSRNGFSRERMRAEEAAAFDDGVRRVLARHCPDGVVRLLTNATIVWGAPCTSGSGAP